MTAISRRTLGAVGTLVAVVALTVGTSAQAASVGKSAPTPKASHFGHNSTLVTNPWFPLARGSVYVYDGQKDGKQARDVMTVTQKTKVIAGIRALPVADRLFLNGSLAERTTDWYAQDKRGTVWYLGEKTAELNANGKVTSTEGSFLNGRDGAKGGIFMPAGGGAWVSPFLSPACANVNNRAAAIWIKAARSVSRRLTLSPG